MAILIRSLAIVFVFALAGTGSAIAASYDLMMIWGIFPATGEQWSPVTMSSKVGTFQDMKQCSAKAEESKAGLNLSFVNAQPPLNDPGFVKNHFFVAASCLAH